MTKQGKQELLKAVRPRYRKASKNEKSQILDEFVASTGYNRKYAIHLLRNGPPKNSSLKKRGRRLIYGPDVIAELVRIWEGSRHLCAKRLHPFLPQMVEALERHNEIHIDERETVADEYLNDLPPPEARPEPIGSTRSHNHQARYPA